MLKNVDLILYISEADWIPREDGICVMTCWSANQLKRKKSPLLAIALSIYKDGYKLSASDIAQKNSWS